MQERDLRIDLVKLIATAMIVILHMIEPGGGYTAMLVFARYIWDSFVPDGQWILNV